MKTLYVVRGSEDGVVGVYSTAKAAFARAVAYLMNGTGGEVIGDLKEAKLELARIDYYRLGWTLSSRTEAVIEAFTLNAK